VTLTIIRCASLALEGNRTGVTDERRLFLAT
jgi:hypothetical protein